MVTYRVIPQCPHVPVVRVPALPCAVKTAVRHLRTSAALIFNQVKAVFVGEAPGDIAVELVGSGRNRRSER